MIGRTISHYKILEKLGEGGMGVVYKAQDTKLKRIVALKFLPQELLCDSESKARFMHEAQAASALNHPNITTIHEIDEVEGECFISMEYIEGNSLKELIHKRTPAIDEILTITLKIAEGLKAAHKKEIVHRDVKSDNVMVTDEGEVKIMDFGLAKLKGVTKLTKTGTTLGTLQYMSPEQAQGKEADQRSDIFSFGVVLYEMITGQLPFKGEHEAAVLYSILNEEPEPVRKLKPEVPVELEGIVKRALQKKPEKRYSDAGEMLTELKKTQADIGVEATLPKRPQRFKPLAWGVGLLLLVGIAVTGVLVLKPWLVSKEAKAKSLAVLSFENLGTEADGYLASGLAEDLAIKLRKLAGFRVASSEDIRRLRKEELLPKQIASRLKVEYALGGSLLKAGDRIRVNVEVIEQASGEVIWSEQFEPKFTDIHEFHDEVSQKIARALKVGLSPAEKVALKQKPTDNPEAYDHYLKGRHYYYNVTFRDNELAEREFERALQFDPDYPLALAGLADAYVQRYKERFDYDEYWLDSAEVLIDRALVLELDLAEAYESRAELLMQEDNIMGALEAAENARDLRPEWDEPYVHLGHIYQERGERSKALAMFDTALTLRPSVDALCGRGNIFQIRGQMDSAKVAYQSALKLNPDHDRPYLELGWLHEELHEGEKAESLYQGAIEVRPDHVAGYQSLSFRLSNWGSIQEGEELLRGFVNRFPYNWDGFKALYKYLDYCGDYAAAFEVVEEAVKRNPERVWPHLLLAYLYAQGMSLDADSGHTTSASEKAVLAVNRALSLRANSGRVLEWAGFVYSYINRLNEAMFYFDQALEVRPGNAETLDNIAWILTYAKEYEKAHEFARRTIKQSPGTWDYHFTLRLALVNLNRWPEFFEIIQKAAEVYGDDPRFLHHLAKEQCLAGDYEESIKTSRRALAAKRALWWWLVSLGVSKWLSGDTDGAIDAFREEKDNYSSAYMIVEILKSEGKFREIEQYMESIKQKTPDQLSGMYHWAGVASSYYMSMRRFDDALAVLNEYRNSGEESFAAGNSLKMARCFLQKGDIVSARRLLEETLDGSIAWVRAKATIELAELQTIIRQDMTEPLAMVEKLQSEFLTTKSGSMAGIDAVTTELVSRLQYASGQYDEVVESLEHIRCDWHSASVSGHYRKAQLAAATNSASADKHLNHAISNLTRLSRGEWHWWSLADPNAYLALSLARAGRKDDSRHQIERALKLEPELEDIAYHAACAYSLIGDTTLALQWLETAVERGHQELWWARVDPDLDPLRKLRRFQEIMNDWDTRLRKLLD